MAIHKIYLHYILATICSTVLLGACAPQQTGDLDRDHRSTNTADQVAVHESMDEYSSLPEPSIDEYLEGRLQGDVEPEPEQTKEQELEDLQRLGTWEEGEPAEESIIDEVQYDFPVTVNKQVEYYLDFFTGRHRKNFEKWLSRSTRYLPMIQEHLREAGLPEDLVYLAMIESGYNERAYSRARAVGIWQFIKPTGRNYGLVINGYVDERRDPIKSTRAAVAYLYENQKRRLLPQRRVRNVQYRPGKNVFRARARGLAPVQLQTLQISPAKLDRRRHRNALRNQQIPKGLVLFSAGKERRTLRRFEKNLAAKQYDTAERADWDQSRGSPGYGRHRCGDGFLCTIVCSCAFSA